MGNNADYGCYAAWRRDCPNARATASSVLLLPCYPGYGEDEVRRNAELIRRYFEERRGQADAEAHTAGTAPNGESRRAVRS
jgi:hypothetical protein